MRWYLDGNGEADSEANQDAYAAEFPGAEADMGCPDSGCIGYELARDLDFDDADSYESGAVNAKWTRGAGWLSIGSSSSNSFSATFEGNDYTIANLYIKRSGITDPGETGLFGENGYGSISRIGLTDVDVTGGNNVGALVGENFGVISASYATGSVSGNRGVGGLVGTTGVDDFWDFGTPSEYPALKADFDRDGVATWQEFGDQREQSPTPPPTSTTTPAVPTPVPQADLELTMLVTNYFGIPFYYMIVENNGPSDATRVVLTDNLPEGMSSMLSIPVTGTCSGETAVVCELGDLTVGSRNLVMIIARLDNALSQSVPVNTASVVAAERDPYPANNSASR